jgi:rhodanese-related sulfurtransferase
MLKKLLSAGVIALISTAMFAQQPQGQAAGQGNGATRNQPPVRAKSLTNAEFDAYLAHPEKILLVDVRRPDEVSLIGGFRVYLSIQLDDLKNHLNEIPRDRAIITISNHTGRAGRAADILSDAGFNVLGALGADTYQTNGGRNAILIKIPAVSDKPGPRPFDNTYVPSTSATSAPTAAK